MVDGGRRVGVVEAAGNIGMNESKIFQSKALEDAEKKTSSSWLLLLVLGEE